MSDFSEKEIVDNDITDITQCDVTTNRSGSHGYEVIDSDKCDTNFNDQDEEQLLKERTIIKIDLSDSILDMKRKLIQLISNEIKINYWKQTFAAKLLEIDQPKVSQLINQKIEGFSVDRLLRFIVLMGFRIEIVIVR
ncbi:MAG: hypothetical protein P857_11 [Candidatus Xenolissoclinum pacificiensis L6]|uniref:HigA2-like helix-turn-helix domain-containing protein n=1 Tax=Candidatus Xenolissoclinum pacificiensis L6 TaxID=1401685 RepID=W2UZZ6_9RICK|nr:MAG: hypothetical protein P857_11 [Candidatus Xenolissoclinum pacificiensis L6]